jgi:hypothetical protein
MTLQFNSTNSLNITDDDYTILINNDVDYEILYNKPDFNNINYDNIHKVRPYYETIQKIWLYDNTFTKYMSTYIKQKEYISLQHHNHNNNDNTINLDISDIIMGTQLLIILDTKKGHYSLKTNGLLLFFTNNLIINMNNLLSKYNDVDGIMFFKIMASKIIPILSNIQSNNIDYSTYKFAWEGIN